MKHQWKNMTNFTMVRHGKKTKNANAYNKKKQTTKSHAFPGKISKKQK